MEEELLSRSQYVTNWPFPQFGAIYDAYGAVVGHEVEIHGRSASVSKLAIQNPLLFGHIGLIFYVSLHSYGCYTLK